MATRVRAKVPDFDTCVPHAIELHDAGASQQQYLGYVEVRSNNLTHLAKETYSAGVFATYAEAMAAAYDLARGLDFIIRRAGSAPAAPRTNRTR